MSDFPPVKFACENCGANYKTLGADPRNLPAYRMEPCSGCAETTIHTTPGGARYGVLGPSPVTRWVNRGVVGSLAWWDTPEGKQWRTQTA